MDEKYRNKFCVIQNNLFKLWKIEKRKNKTYFGHSKDQGRRTWLEFISIWIELSLILSETYIFGVRLPRFFK